MDNQAAEVDLDERQMGNVPFRDTVHAKYADSP